MTTPEQVHAMSDDELRVKIAEALGWKVRVVKLDTSVFEFLTRLINTNGEPIRAASGQRSLEYFENDLPNWPADLSAAAELTEQMRGDFFMTLIIFHDYDQNVSVQCDRRRGHDEPRSGIDATSATEPRARSEAFYKWWLETHK
jgi:hypothetical protein